jgi:hypothetical protein
LATSSAILFADDATLAFVANNLQSLNKIVNDDLDAVQIWLNVNKLTLNIPKTNYLLFFNQKPNTTKKVIFTVKINNTLLTRTLAATILGVTLDQHLTFQDHIKKVKSKLSSALFILTRVRGCLSFSTAIQFYHSFFASHLSYCLSVWGSSAQSYLHPIQVLQNRYLKKILYCHRRTHSSIIYKQLSILPLLDLYRFHVALLIHKFVYNIVSLPAPLHSVFKSLSHTHTHSTRSSTSLDLFIPSHSKLSRKNSIAIQGPLIWNNLSFELKTIISISKFKFQLKNYLLNATKP